MTQSLHFNLSNILQLEQRQRVNLINSSGGFKSVCLIGTMNEDKQMNLAIFSSIVHLGASPPLVAFVMRPDNDERHTLHNILSTGFYTINHINEAILVQAHQTSASYPRAISEFDAVGLTPDFKDDFFAPYVQESNVKMGLQFREKIDIALNGTSLIIGEIQHLYVPEDCLSEDHFIDIERANTVTCSGLDSYHTTKALGRLSYAKPDRETTYL